MFKNDKLDTKSDKVNTVIGKETHFKGTINGQGLLRIDGRAEGDIFNKGDVIIGESGHVVTGLKARNVTIAGHYEGELIAEGKLELKRSALVAGTFKTNGLIIEDGAVISGNVEMKNKDGSEKDKNKYEPSYNVADTEKQETKFSRQGTSEKVSS